MVNKAWLYDSDPSARGGSCHSEEEQKKSFNCNFQPSQAREPTQWSANEE